MSAITPPDEAPSPGPTPKADPLAAVLSELRAIHTLLARPALSDRLAVDAPALATALSISERSVWTLCATGELPPPVKLGGRSVWRVEAVRRALDERAARTAKRK
jgi:predicted DNA-binding transcriptional regulator AlpA